MYVEARIIRRRLIVCVCTSVHGAGANPEHLLSSGRSVLCTPSVQCSAVARVSLQFACARSERHCSTTEALYNTLCSVQHCTVLYCTHVCVSTMPCHLSTQCARTRKPRCSQSHTVAVKWTHCSVAQCTESTAQSKREIVSAKRREEKRGGEGLVRGEC